MGVGRILCLIFRVIYLYKYAICKETICESPLGNLKSQTRHLKSFGVYLFYEISLFEASVISFPQRAVGIYLGMKAKNAISLWQMEEQCHPAWKPRASCVKLFGALRKIEHPWYITNMTKSGLKTQHCS